MKISDLMGLSENMQVLDSEVGSTSYEQALLVRVRENQRESTSCHGERERQADTLKVFSDQKQTDG